MIDLLRPVGATPASPDHEVLLHLSGGLLLLDPRLAGQLGNDFGDDVANVLDPEGGTTQSREALEYRIRELPRSRERLKQFCTDSGFVLLLAPRGEYLVALRRGQLTQEEKRKSVRSVEAWVSVEQERLVLADVQVLFGGPVDLSGERDVASLPWENGNYLVTLHQMTAGPTTAGVFVGGKTPALIFCFSAASGRPAVPVEVASLEFEQGPSPTTVGSIQRAVVRKIRDGNVVILELRLTRDIYVSGYAQLNVRSTKLKPGDELWVRVLGHVPNVKGRWLVEEVPPPV